MGLHEYKAAANEILNHVHLGLVQWYSGPGFELLMADATYRSYRINGVDVAVHCLPSPKTGGELALIGYVGTERAELVERAEPVEQAVNEMIVWVARQLDYPSGM